MVDALINIFNSARGHLGLSPVQVDSFNSAFVRSSLEGRNQCLRYLKEIGKRAGEDQKLSFTLTLSSGTNEYALPCAPQRIAGLEFYLKDASGDNDKPLLYYNEKDILWEYSGDLSDIPSGEPYGWFLKTGDTNSYAKSLSFVLAPDATYTLTGWHYADLVTTITATTLTSLDTNGDFALEMLLMYEMKYMQSLITDAEMERQQLKIYAEYCCKDLKVNKRAEYNAPHQHGTATSGIAYTRGGTAFV